MDNNEDMKVPYQQRPEGTAAVLNEIALHHRQSISYYKSVVDALDATYAGAKDFFSSLISYRKELLTAINGKLADMVAGVHTPSRSSESYLKQQEKQLVNALRASNIVQLAQLAYENENHLSDTYRYALANNELIDFAEELLHEQHQTVLLWVNRADRFKTVPQQRNEDLK